MCSYRDLNYISLAMVTAATTVSFLLPPVSSTIYFHTGPESGVDIYSRSLPGKSLPVDIETISILVDIFSVDIHQ